MSRDEVTGMPGSILIAPDESVKQFLLRLAAMFGLVPARRYAAVVNQMEEARASAKTWKGRTGEALARVKAVEAELAHHAKQLKEARRTAEKVRRQGDVGELQNQLAQTERELMLAREHLMAIEVKLDILEGAANVLDARTRSAIRQSTSTGAAV
jgi:hypothetical protein